MQKRLFFKTLLVMLTIGLNAQVNYDESKVPEYQLPEVLVSNAGNIISTKEDWQQVRKPEILGLFEEHVYGRIPTAAIQHRFEVANVSPSAMCGLATQKLVNIYIGNGDDSVKVELLVYLPKNVEGPVPLFLGLNFYGNHSIHGDPTIPLTNNYVRNNPVFCIFDNKATHQSRGVRASRWPVERILERGYGLATIYYGDLDPDFDDGYQNGIHPLFYKEGQTQPEPNEWGAIGAWAYGLSRAMDYFETDNDIDQERVAVIGHSRLGKAALWAGAQDDRFAMVISNDSGCGGAALSKRQYGETVARINTSFPHWFCMNFRQYNKKEADLPLDQHMLLSLIAPRPLYVASAEQDRWADPLGEFSGLFHAGPAYDLMGETTIRILKMPEINKPLIMGKMGYHIRSGEHDITRYDWERYMDFADEQLK